jgi:SAM-dependent methyltransferase
MEAGMSSPNDNSVKDSWQGAVAERWVQEQKRLDEMMRPFGQAAQMTLAAASGEWVLDIGCGAGTTSFELAQTVGASGGVVGLDISEPLLQHARERAAAAGATNVQFVLADAANHRFERAFDALYSRFGVMFFTDPVGAFNNLHGALHSSGRLAFVCWQDLERNPWARLPLMAARSAAPNTPVPAIIQPGQPGPFAFGDQEYVSDSLRAAGFRHVDITAFERQVHMGSTAQDAADFCMLVGPASRIANEADPSLTPKIHAAVVKALEAFETPRGVLVDAATYVVSSRA